MVANNIGSVVEGEDFFDRKAELDELRSEGLTQNLLLLAPRRVGKTSLLHRLATVEAREEGWAAVYCSVEDAADERGFLRSLVESLERAPAAKPAMKRLRRGALGRYLRGVDKVKLGPIELSRGRDEGDAFDELLRETRQALLKLPGHWFLLVDEVPLFVLRLLDADPTGARARRFLQWFRRVRQREVDTDVTLHWVLAGSIGLDTVAQRNGLSDTINDLRVVRLGAFDAATARDFLHALGDHYKIALADEVITTACDRAGWLIPYHLQAIFGELRSIQRESARDLIADDVDRAVDRLLQQSSYFDTWQQRLSKELGADRAARAMALLTASARDPVGATLSTLGQTLAATMADIDARDRELRWLLDVLESDGYLRTEGERRPFRSNLLRQYWLRRYA